MSVVPAGTVTARSMPPRPSRSCPRNLIVTVASAVPEFASVRLVVKKLPFSPALRAAEVR